MLFLLGLKEHMGIVPLGFGCYLILQRKEQLWIGLVLIVLGLTALFSITYGLIPFFRGNQPSWSVPALDFWGNLPGKIHLQLETVFLLLSYHCSISELELWLDLRLSKLIAAKKQ